MVSKKQIAMGIADFLDEVLIPSLSDRQVKMVLSVARSAMKKDPDMLDSFLDNPLVSSVMPDCDGMYDAKGFLDIMKKSLEEGGYFTLTIPKIPLLMQEDKNLRLTSADIDDLLRMLNPEPEDED